MKWLVALWFCLSLLCFATVQLGTADPAPPAITADSAILVDAATGKVLYEKRCRVRRPPASTSKMMTAILAIEHGDLKDTVRVSKRASNTPFSSLNLKPGEKLSLEDLLYGLLLRSANDAAVCIAEHIGGSEKKFVAMMNEKAKEIGAMDTYFANPHGLNDPKHYSTAYDLALIARYAIRMPVFNEIVATKTKRIERSINSKDIYIKNAARFLWKFDGADGIKTGYTRQAGHCFVGSATRDGWRLIVVVLKSKDAGEDAAALLSFGFKFYKQVSFARANEVVTTVPVANGVLDRVNVVAREDLAVVLRKSAEAKTGTSMNVREAVAPIDEGEELGTLTGYLNGEKVGSVDLLSAETVGRVLAAAFRAWVRSTFTISILFLVGYVTYGTAVAKTARRRRRSFAARG